MRYKMYTGNQPILEALQAIGIVNAESLKHLKVQEFEAANDTEAIDEINDFMEHTGIPVRVITRVGDGGEEIIVHRFGN